MKQLFSRSLIIILLAGIILIAAGYGWMRRGPVPTKHETSSGLTATGLSPQPSKSNRRPALSLLTGNAAQQHAGESDPELIGLKEILRSYRSTLGENPVGNNAEIAKALLGGNPRGARFDTPEMKTKAGQIIDRWGHPYFFHQLSRTEMEIRSAGPDGVMWTADDEVLE